MSEITRIPLLDKIENPIFRRVMRRAILENRRMVQFDIPERSGGKVLAFRKLSTLPRVGKEDPVDA